MVPAVRAGHTKRPVVSRSLGQTVNEVVVYQSRSCLHLLPFHAGHSLALWQVKSRPVIGQVLCLHVMMHMAFSSHHIFWLQSKGSQ